MKFISILITSLLLSHVLLAQNMLTRSDAINIAFENNYDIKTAQRNVAISENNSSLKNTGYLPSVTASGGVSYSNNTTDVELNDGSEFEIKNAETYNYDAVVAVNYVLFDGFGRSNILKQLKETYYLNELQARQVMESTIVQLFNSYYLVARLTENENTIRQSLNISKTRKIRAKYSFDYGQATQLDVLNAQVDVNNDSINYLNTIQQLENAKRDLNLILGRDINTAFVVDTIVDFNPDLGLDNLLSTAMERNVRIEQANSALINSELGIKANRSSLYPSINANGSYGWNRTEFGFNPNLNSQAAIGPAAGVNLSWNIFDGGRTSVTLQNAKINNDIQRISQEQTQQSVQRDVNNAWYTYKNALYILDAEGDNLSTNKLNFERTNEQYKLGQLSSVDFRLAQVNLLNARSNYSAAKYDAKIAEITLLQLSGELLDSDF